ncbi:MAG: chorismate synthase [Paludibacteraceae bacterium]
MNTFGHIFRLTTFGESHGTAIGGIIDGCPAGIDIDTAFVQAELDRRKPGQSSITTQRNEADRVEFLSGIFDGKTTGAPIGFCIANTDHRSSDYEHLKSVYRPGHADYTYQQKYGIRDYRGGGRASARETAARIVAGAIAKLALRNIGVHIAAYTAQIGNIAVNKPYQELDLTQTENNIVRCPDAATATQMVELIDTCRRQGDSIGGIVQCVISGAPIGLGEPLYGKLQAELAYAMLSINAAKGFDYGSGFEHVALTGSSLNDAFYADHEHIGTRTNFAGGIQGGITNGADIYFRVVFKPTPTISQAQQTIDTDGNAVELAAHGRHDACVVPRAVPVVEAMAAIVLFDAYLQNRSATL